MKVVIKLTIVRIVFERIEVKSYKGILRVEARRLIRIIKIK